MAAAVTAAAKVAGAVRAVGIVELFGQVVGLLPRTVCLPVYAMDCQRTGWSVQRRRDRSSSRLRNQTLKKL